MTGGELLGFVATVLGGAIWGLGWWWENVWPTTYRYRHSRVRMWLDERRNDGLASIRRIPLGTSHFTLRLRSKVPLQVKDFSVRFVSSKSEEGGEGNTVNPDCLRVTEARLVDDRPGGGWPATEDDKRGGRSGVVDDTLPAHTPQRLHVEVEAGSEWWGPSLYFSLRLHVEGAEQPIFAMIPAATLPASEAREAQVASRPLSGAPA